jgi:hypothetical protein
MRLKDTGYQYRRTIGCQQHKQKLYKCFKHLFQSYLNRLAVEFDDIAANDFFALSGFCFTIDHNPAVSDDRLRFTATGDHSFKLQNFVELNGFPGNFDFSHRYPGLLAA